MDVRWLMKRGELSMEVIIIAAIALLVLVILTVLLLRGGLNLSTGTACTSPSINGVCVDSGASCDSGYIPSANTCGDKQKCCVPLAKQ